MLTLGVPLSIVSWRVVDDLMRSDLNSRLDSIAASIANQSSSSAIDLGQLAAAVPSGGRLEISLAGIDGDFILKVKDTGSGIPADLTRRIFDPYFTTKENGTGLGLALVQYIANAHEGWVGVESTMNEGATFSFSVPVEAGKNRPKGVIE